MSQELTKKKKNIAIVTDGSQVTVSHGHLSFYGAYVLLNLTFFYMAMPRLKGLPNDAYDQKTGQFGFWLTSLGIVGMSLAFAWWCPGGSP